MKKTIIMFLMFILIFIVGCDSNASSKQQSTTLTSNSTTILTTTENMEIKLGYSTGMTGQRTLPAYAALRSSDSLVPVDSFLEITFEYGSNQYSRLEDMEEGSIFSAVVFVSKYKNNFNRYKTGEEVLYEEELSNLFEEDNNVSGNVNDAFQPIHYHQSFDLSISVRDLIDNSGYLYFVIQQSFVNSRFETIIRATGQVIGYVIVDGYLNFYINV